MPTQPTATRYECIHRDGVGFSASHDSGNGKPPRKKCRYCGGAFVIMTGWHCVFVWRGDGRYRLEDAVAICSKIKTAELAATLRDDYVVRWIMAPTAQR